SIRSIIRRQLLVDRPFGNPLCHRWRKNLFATFLRACNFPEKFMAEVDNDEQFYRDTESVAFPKLDDRQLAMLEPLGKRRILRRGEMLFKAGQRDLGLTVILSGGMEVFESRDGQEQILGSPGPRDFVGDVAMPVGS